MFVPPLPKREYWTDKWQPYGAGDLFCMDHYVDYDFSGNVLDELIQKYELKVLTDQTAVLLGRNDEIIALLFDAKLKSRHGLTWPGYC